MKAYIYMYELKLRYSPYHSDYLTSAVRFSKLRSFREAKKYIQTTMLGLTIDIFVFVGKLKFYLLWTFINSVELAVLFEYRTVYTAR